MLPPLQGGASDVGKAIVRYASDVDADLVVQGSRGMGGVKSLLMSCVGIGSVSSYTMHHSDKPLLVVKRGDPQLESEAA